MITERIEPTEPAKAEGEGDFEAHERSPQETWDALYVANILIVLQQQRIEALERERKMDKLTQGHNENALLEFMEKRHRVEGSAEKTVLMYVDANRFKEINDTLGHDAGDFILREIMTYLREKVRSTDIVARLHGDEFVVVFTETTEEELMQKFANEKLAFTANYKGEEISISLSAGLATHEEYETVEQTLERADKAMYLSKGSRDGRVSRLANEKSDETL